MGQQEIIENNTRLLVFMGHTKNIPITDGLALSLGFDKDWRTLMAVVEKIMGKGKPSPDCPVNYKRVEIFKEIGIFSPIDKVYTACADFVKWYNENKAL